MTVLQPLEVTPTPDGRNWKLVSDLVVLLRDGTKITVHEGYITDGESGPSALKSLILKPNNNRQVAAFVHDALYQAGMQKKWADNVYAEILAMVGIDHDEEWALYEAVHLFGDSSYDADQRDHDQVLAAINNLTIE